MRGRTINRRALPSAVRLERDVSPDNVRHLPMTRAECVDGERPCPFVTCTHHLYLDVTESGGIKLNFPDLQPDELAFSCALDIADAGGVTLEQVGAALNVTRERIRQMEDRAMKKMRLFLKRRRIDVDDLAPVGGAISWFGERG